jgi:hypothetical protein
MGMATLPAGKSAHLVSRKSSFMNQRGSPMSEIWIFVLIFAAWFALQAVILPRLGIST